MPDEKIAITTSDKDKDGNETFEAFLGMPPGGKGPGLLVLPEIYNSNEHIRGVAQGFAAEGFVTLAPEVFWRLQPQTYLPYTEHGQAQARALNQRLDVDALVDDLGVCIATLKEMA